MPEEKFIVQPEEIAASINGETPGGEQMILGNDVLIYSKFVVTEQPVLNRLRANKESGTLINEIDRYTGQIYLGELEAVRARLHANVDEMFEAIIAYRKSHEKQN